MKTLKKTGLKYNTLIGTGGIGSGSFFKLNGDHTLGREESRAGRFLDSNDYCKLHIIAHYPQVLLGSEFTCLPIGRVGDDAVGHGLISEMRDAGMDTRFVEPLAGEQTLFSFCFLYPDDTGGNLTVDDSASSKVDEQAIDAAEKDMERTGRAGIALAAPEVPLAPRARLLELAGKHGLFRAATFVTDEIRTAADEGLLAQCDLLALNRDEAAAVAGLSAADAPQDIAAKAIETLTGYNSEILVSITAGRHGSWAWDGTELHHVPGLKVDVASTAGAGDCHFGTLLAGLAAELAMQDAQQLASLAAALSATSPHTINKDIDRASLLEFAEQSLSRLPDPVSSLLK